MRIVKCPIDTEGATFLIASLTSAGTPNSMTAAQEIRRGVEWDVRELAFTPQEKDALLACLDGQPRSLRVLRDTLAQGHADRSRRWRPADSQQCASCGQFVRGVDFRLKSIREAPPVTVAHVCPHCHHECTALGRVTYS